MFERFSKGYYLGRLFVQQRRSGAPVICREQHERLYEQYYDSTTDAPDSSLVMKLGSTHLSVQPEAGIPSDTLSVPENVLESATPGEQRNVLLAKADRARQLLPFAVSESGDGDVVERDPFRPNGLDGDAGPGPS